MITVTLLFVIAAFLCVIAAAMGKVPLWVAVLLVVVTQMLMVMPK